MAWRFSRWAWMAGLLCPVLGCHKSWSVDTMTPPIAFGATQDARTSLPAIISLRDMDLPRGMRLTNSVYFVAVSKDRLRFHVTLRHKWEDMSDPTRWRVWIEDDQGNVIEPTAVDRRVIKPVSTLPDGRPFTCSLGCVVYKGDGDYVFYQRDLVRKGMRSLTLVMIRPGYEYRYRWSFVDEDFSAEQARRPLRRCDSLEERCSLVASPSR